MFQALTPAYQLRQMTEEDLTLVWKWRNHPDIRAASKRQGEITWEEHLNWFYGNEMDRFIFSENDRTIGVLVFNEDYWGFYMDPDLPKGKGLGQLMLSLFLTYVKSDLPWITEIRAQVVQTNLPSIKLHTKLGFETVQVNDGIYEFRLPIGRAGDS